MPSPISTVTIVTTKEPVFTSNKVPSSFSSSYIPRKPSPIASLSVVVTRAPVEIRKIASIYKEKSPFQPVTTIFFPSDKAPAIISSIYVPSKP